MELFYRFSVVVAIVSTLALSSCTDDVYDPERGIQTKPKENPLGEDFTAPDGFDWSMVNTVNLNVETMNLTGDISILLKSLPPTRYPT